MRAFRLSGADGDLRLVDEPNPLPGPGQLLIDVKAATLNYRDTIVRGGNYGGMQKENLIPLSDAAGIVTDVGEGVSRSRIGARVAIGFMPGWTDGPFTAAKQAGALSAGRLHPPVAGRPMGPCIPIPAPRPPWRL